MVGEQNPWHTRRIADLFSVKKSNTLSRDKLNYEQGACKDVHYGDVLVKYGCVLDLGSSDVPYITNNDDVTGEYLCDGDVVFADTAEDLTVGKACEIAGASERKAVAGLHTIVLRPQPGLFASGFLGYYVNSRHFHETMIPFAHGTKVTSISSNDLLNLVIPIPPRPEQEAIAKTLDDIDSLIESLEIFIAKKRDLREGLAEALLTGAKRLPGCNHPWIPCTVGELGSLKKGAGIRRGDSGSGLIPCIRYGEIYTTYSAYTYELETHISNSVAMTATSIKTGDIVFACTGETKEDIGKCVAYLGTQVAYAGGDTQILTLNKEVDSLFLASLLNTSSMHRQMASYAQGDAVVHLAGEAIKAISLLLPSIQEQRVIANVLSDFDGDIEALEHKLAKYKQVRQGMMRELLTGHIRLAQE